MTRSPRSIVVPACLAFLACFCGSLPASAKDIDSQELSDQALAALRAMRYSGPVPALTGFSAGREVKLSPLKGGKDYSTSYRSKEGCVVFFSPLEKGQHDLGLKWEGRKCDGQPVQGEGTLSISYQFDMSSESIQRVFVFRGKFENGMLFGKGEKANFSFDASGKPKEDVYSFSGDFAHGLLNGVGRKTWTRSATSEPSTQVEEGNFSEGTPLGVIIFSQLNPCPGVEAETKTLIFDTDGRPFRAQPDSKGAIFFTGDTLGWNTKVSTLNDDSSLASAVFYRAPRATDGFGYSLVAGCVDWKIRADGLRCKEGVLTWLAPGSVHRLQMTPGKPFNIPMPFKTSGSPVRVDDDEKFSLEFLQRPSEGNEVTCNSDLSSCQGKSILWISSRTYFAGKVQYESGEVRPRSGFFLESLGPWKPSVGTDKKVAACKEFRTPTQCRIGWFMAGKDSWTGGYALKALEFDARSGYRQTASGFRFSMEGNGRITWAEHDAWADLYAEDDRIISVGKCDNPDEPGAVTCHLDGNGTIVLVSKGR